MRTWNDKAKLVEYMAPELEAYESLILQYLKANR